LCDSSPASWKDKAREEIAGIKQVWSNRYAWCPVVAEADPNSDEGVMDLYVRFVRKDREYVVRLRYEKDFETAGRRETFVDAKDVRLEGPGYWPTDMDAVKHSNNPPAICLEGTWGFHSVLHRERDGRLATLNRLLMELQICMRKS
jgi:hypothetical protein